MNKLLIIQHGIFSLGSIGDLAQITTINPDHTTVVAPSSTSTNTMAAPISLSNESVPVLQPPSADPSTDLEAVLQEIVVHCNRTNITNNPVEILRYLQTRLVLGRALDVVNVAESVGGDTNYMLVDRYRLLETVFDEIDSIQNKFLTLEVQFYGEVRNIGAVSTKRSVP